MKILLDTCVYLFASDEPERIPETIRDALIEPENDLYISIASIWELLIKWKRGRMSIVGDPAIGIPQQCKKLDLAVLPLELNAVLQSASLPDIHKDPFDRILVCQARANDMIIVTPDEKIAAYDVETIW